MTGCHLATKPSSPPATASQPAAALAFMLAAPAVNPIVLMATAVAFPG